MRYLLTYMYHKYPCENIPKIHTCTNTYLKNEQLSGHYFLVWKFYQEMRKSGRVIERCCVLFMKTKSVVKSIHLIWVQFPNSVPVIVNLDLTLNFVTLIGRPQYNGRFCWQASLLHLRPSFSSTRMITRTIYVQDLSSGTVLLLFT